MCQLYCIFFISLIHKAFMLLYSPYKIHAYIAQAHATKKLDCYVVHVLTGQLLSPVSFVNYPIWIQSIEINSLDLIIVS